MLHLSVSLALGMSLSPLCHVVMSAVLVSEMLRPCSAAFLLVWFAPTLRIARLGFCVYWLFFVIRPSLHTGVGCTSAIHQCSAVKFGVLRVLVVLGFSVRLFILEFYRHYVWVFHGDYRGSAFTYQVVVLAYPVGAGCSLAPPCGLHYCFSEMEVLFDDQAGCTRQEICTRAHAWP